MRLVFCCSDTNPDPWLQGLRAALPGAEVSLWQPGENPIDAADFAVVWAPPQAFIDAHPGLRALFNIGAGVDALLRLRLSPGMKIVRLDDAGMAVQMAEYVCHTVIRQYRQFDAIAADVATGRWAPLMPPPRDQFTVGLLGLGVLGQRVAQALQAFEFPVMGWSRTPKTLPGVHSHTGPEGLRAVLAASRVLVNLLPLTPDTRDLLNRHTLAQLPAGAHVINLARGAHLVEDDLLALIDSGHLGGATLDVFRTEPLPAGHPFWAHPRITVTPHTSARTLRTESVAQIAHKIRAWQRGEPIRGVVDLALGY
jgi:glyoxylate/hydroxypyruvate reductase A